MNLQETDFYRWAMETTHALQILPQKTFPKECPYQSDQTNYAGKFLS